MTQTQASSDELLREGGAALRGGERERARALLAQAVRLNPRSEQAWLLLAGAVTDPEQRRSCLERVLRLNPEHSIARRAMATLQTAEERPPASAERAPSAGSLLGRLRQPEQPAAPTPAAQAAASAQPLSYEQREAAPALATPQPAPVARPSGNPELIELSTAAVRRKDQERRLWMAVLAAGVVMMLVGLTLVVLVLLAG